MRLNGKVIFIISYENWGKMLMSKHHYAIELGKAGNKVFFINRPDKLKELGRGEVKVEQTGSQNVMVVRHRLFHPFFFKYKFPRLYNFLTSFHIRKILKGVGVKPDIVWSFDTGNTLPLKYFPTNAIKLYMPVDGPFGTEDEDRAAEQSDGIISVTEHLLSAYDKFEKPRFQINHGVAEVFLNGTDAEKRNAKIRVGYSGSLIRNDLDTDCFLTIIRDHPEVTFEFWGEDDYMKSNIHLPQDVKAETHFFLDTLKKMPNVIMHGPVNSEDLAKGLMKMDAFLVCYNVKNDPNNRHKVLEYLGTGKVIIASYMDLYAQKDPDLVTMVKSKENNDEFPVLFQEVVNNLDYYNSGERRQKRIEYARDHSYVKNIGRIESFINDFIPSK